MLGQNGAINTEQVRNIIIMSPSAHAYWDQCIFALKPTKLHEDRKTLEVEFWWLPIRDAKTQPRAVFVGTKPDLTTASDSPGNNVSLLYCGAKKEVLESGKKLQFTTPVPDQYPLPSFELLEMQWVLHRIAALHGAAADDSDSDDDSDGDDEADWLPSCGLHDM